MYKEINYSDLAAMLSGEDFVYCPNRGNLGDSAIMQGTLLFFEHHLPDKKISFANNVAADTLLIYGGGGALVEGLYAGAHTTLQQHLENGGNLLVLPSTIVGFTSFFNNYAKQLRIICREKRSYDDLLSGGFPEEQLYLCHDMAFFLQQSLPWREPSALQPSATLFALREDAEKKISHPFAKKTFDISNLKVGRQGRREAKYGTALMFDLLDLHSAVVTDRLHVAILASLTGKTCYLLENSYYKNRAVFDYSIRNFYPDTRLVQDIEEIPDHILNAPSLMPHLHSALKHYLALKFV